MAGVRESAGEGEGGTQAEGVGSCRPGEDAGPCRRRRPFFSPAPQPAAPAQGALNTQGALTLSLPEDGTWDEGRPTADSFQHSAAVGGRQDGCERGPGVSPHQSEVPLTLPTQTLLYILEAGSNSVKLEERPQVNKDGSPDPE